MSCTLSIGQISILYSLRDGDDPLLRAPETELIFFNRDLALLETSALIAPSGKGYALTLQGADELRNPLNAYTFSSVE